jgi:DNA-binding transcriptional LysR family regulator
VAQAGSVTLGAERLDISQPAVSKQVRELERALGVHLFDRVGRRVRLSRAGEVLADYARRLAGLRIGRPLHLVRRRGRRDGSALQAFCGVLRERTAARFG